MEESDSAPPIILAGDDDTEVQLEDTTERYITRRQDWMTSMLALEHKIKSKHLKKLFNTTFKPSVKPQLKDNLNILKQSLKSTELHSLHIIQAYDSLNK